jgi:hypothetical protein
LPTNTVVASQQQRSQFKNKAQAMKMLKNKLYQAEVERREREKGGSRFDESDVSFGSQIRSYVFQPYTMVNDHRTELKIPDVQKVMDGAIDPSSPRISSTPVTAWQRNERGSQLRPSGATREARCDSRKWCRAVWILVLENAHDCGSDCGHASRRVGRSRARSRA